MLRLKNGLLWLVLLIGLTAISTSCKPVFPVSKEYRGTIYYGSDTGVWKMTLPGKGATLLTNMRALPNFNISPDRKWLTYYAALPQDDDDHWLRSLWIVSTQGGEPIQVSRDVLEVGVLGWENGWLRYLEVLDFRPDPNYPGYFVPDHSEAYSFNPETGERRPDPQSSLGATPTRQSSCWELAIVQGERHDTTVEQCVDASGDSFLRASRLDGSSSITVPMAYRREELGWSGDRKWLAFAGKDISETRQAFMLNLDEMEARQVTKSDSQEDHELIAPSWSPDGRWLAFQDDPDLCLVKAENGEIKCFKGYVSHLGEEPAWSPDSRAIVVASNRIGQLLMGESDLVVDLFVIRVPEGDVTRITDDPDGEFGPIWEQ